MADIKIIVTAKDCHRDTFRCGGKGGQKQNKTDSGVRFRHEPSGAVGESREERSQVQNEKIAWRRMCEHPRFVLWCKMQLAAREEGFRSMERKVDVMLDERNLRVESGPDAAECIRGEAECVR